MNREAMRAMAAGDLVGAKGRLQQALSLSQADPALWLNLAACERALGDAEAALAAAEGALAQDPRHFMALLMKATLLERMGRAKPAANAYGVALTQAPPDDRLDEPTRQALRHARQVHGGHLVDLHEFVREELAETLSQAAAVEAKRLRAFTEMLVGVRRNYRQQPVEFFYPGMPAIEFYERDMFPWLGDLEAQTAVIRDELQAALSERADQFTPYIKYSENVPLDQWAELNHSSRWSAFHLIESGARQEANCALCPKTMEAISHLPQPQIPGRSPAAMFSQLQPHTRIPPHTGVANIRLVMHLPLIVPPGCGFRVGNETREWRVGEGWVFDDTVEHEAWNGSDQPRVILICDVWSPFLSPAERDGIARVMSAIDSFNETVPTAGV